MIILNESFCSKNTKIEQKESETTKSETWKTWTRNENEKLTIFWEDVRFLINFRNSLKLISYTSKKSMSVIYNIWFRRVCSYSRYLLKKTTRKVVWESKKSEAKQILSTRVRRLIVLFFTILWFFLSCITFYHLCKKSSIDSSVY